MPRQSWIAEEIRSDILPELERRFGEVYCRVEQHRILFRFSTEETAICGETAINEYRKAHGIPGRTLNRESRTVILFIGPGDDF